jgi:L-asparaginase
MSIKVLITGGTIDKRYNPVNGQLIFGDGSFIQDMLKDGRYSYDLSFETLFLKDSLDMNDNDRKIISQNILSSKEDKIILTHGTDSMIQTASYLANNSLDAKTIILVGAMVPYKFKNSDALFNLGTAFGAIKILEKGIYIAMNGEIFRWNEVYKNVDLGFFQRL